MKHYWSSSNGDTLETEGISIASFAAVFSDNQLIISCGWRWVEHIESGIWKIHLNGEEGFYELLHSQVDWQHEYDTNPSCVLTFEPV